MGPCMATGREAALKLGIDEFYIGASNVDNDWEWLDGSAMNYSNFDVEGGYPMLSDSQVGAVSVQSLTKLWYTKSDSIKLPFVCERKSQNGTDEYIYRMPKNRLLQDVTGRRSKTQVQPADQSVLYQSIGPKYTEPETGNTVYLKNLYDGLPAPPTGQPIVVIMNKRRQRKKLAPLIVTETETDIDTTRKEKTSDELNRKMTSNGDGNVGDGSSMGIEENSKKSKEIEENQKIRHKTRTLKRG
ncbi:unnamed protein product [Caenorhabditis bovis]|uniref:C-type lectin domain-containing protein n=1 Tax=Caenorhabditis bovis TaxID=2654633 RepID=A0A8S1ES94_9PELO|nr:unnamed protein product [Caenorhabditis bovis]